MVRSDGTLLIQSFPLDRSSPISTYRDLKGRAQDAPESDDDAPAVSMAGEPAKAGVFTPHARAGTSRLRSL